MVTGRLTLQQRRLDLQIRLVAMEMRRRRRSPIFQPRCIALRHPFLESVPYPGVEGLLPTFIPSCLPSPSMRAWRSVAGPQRTGLESGKAGEGILDPRGYVLPLPSSQAGGPEAPHIPPQKQAQLPSCKSSSDTSLARLMTDASCSQCSAEGEGEGRLQKVTPDGGGQRSA